jgi:hypothetical protein
MYNHTLTTLWRRALLAAVSIAGLASILATGLDTSGPLREFKECKGYDTSHYFREDSSAYTFAIACDVSTRVDSAGPVYNFRVSGKYDVQEKVAKETVEDPPGTYGVYVTASCPDDPWLNDIRCSITNVASQSPRPIWEGFVAMFVNREGRPISATLLTASDRQRLKDARTEELSHPTSPPPPPPPPPPPAPH